MNGINPFDSQLQAIRQMLEGWLLDKGQVDDAILKVRDHIDRRPDAVTCHRNLISREKTNDSLCEHIRLGFHQVIVDGLEMQPANVIRAHVLAAVTGPIGWHQLGLLTRGLHQKLLLTATL